MKSVEQIVQERRRARLEERAAELDTEAPALRPRDEEEQEDDLPLRWREDATFSRRRYTEDGLLDITPSRLLPDGTPRRRLTRRERLGR